MLTFDRLREVLEYIPESGVFVRRVSLGSRWRAGQIAGSLSVWGYIEIRLDNKLYKAHRLAWLYMTGGWPKAQIDHINLIKTDNRWVNLREATQAQNNSNRTAYNSDSGIKGVYPSGRKWQAKISGKYIGTFNTPQEANAAYLSAAKSRFGEFTRG